MSALIVITACQKLPLNSKRLNFRKISVGSREEAIAKLESKLSFTAMTFEQFKDSVYLFSKWPTSCLAENKIGELKRGKNLLAVSKLYLRFPGVPGFCAHHENVVYSYQVLLHCHGESFIREITCPVEDCEGVNWKAQC